MGFGPCTKPLRRIRRRPPGAPPLPEEIIQKRIHCETFYWNATSAILKTACLSMFFVVETPRRIVAFMSKRPEPKPFLDCSPFGYRLCACNHHYYDHLGPGQSFQPSTDVSKPRKLKTLPFTEEELTGKKNRKWFWLF